MTGAKRVCAVSENGEGQHRRAQAKWAIDVGKRRIIRIVRWMWMCRCHWSVSWSDSDSLHRFCKWKIWSVGDEIRRVIGPLGGFLARKKIKSLNAGRAQYGRGSWQQTEWFCPGRTLVRGSHGGLVRFWDPTASHSHVLNKESSPFRTLKVKGRLYRPG